MKHLKKLFCRLYPDTVDQQRRREPDPTAYIDNYMLLGSILGSYCGTLSGKRRGNRH